MITHASELEVASVRARLRWVEAIDVILDGGGLDPPSQARLAAARAELGDLSTPLSHDDLHRLGRLVRSHRDPSPAMDRAQPVVR